MPRFASLLCLAFMLPTSSFAAERYVAMFADGSRAEEAEVREWNEPAAEAKIGGKNLFDPGNPVRWIIDRNQPSTTKPTMFVEFDGGDRLAGEVVASFDGRENPYETRPPYLVVRPMAELQPAEITTTSEVRVTLEWVRRVVWEHVGSDDYRPGTVWLRTGVAVPFRSLRWSTDGITVLTGNGIKEIARSDLGEIHLPKRNPWAAYYDQLAILSPQLKSRLIQWDCTDGSRWTASSERFQARHHGDRNRPEQWYQLIQPAWSLDSIWLRYRTIRTWRFFSPHEVPLSNFSPIEATHQSVFGGGWDWQLDQNVEKGPLRSVDKEFGWGFGVHGTSKLAFEYPEIARAVRVQFGLDRSAGTGGCVNVDVQIGNGQSAMKQTNLIGSEILGTMDWQELPIGPAEHRRIEFRTEMAHQNRPAGADPFDVRDIFNWYEPELQLDSKMLEAEVFARSAARLPGLIDWVMSPEDASSIRIANVADTFDGRDPQFRLVARSIDPFYIISRNVKVGSRDRWLALAVSRFNENTSPTTVQIRVSGRVLGEFEIPLRQSITDPEPMLIPVDRYQGTTISVEVVVYPTDEKSWVEWRGLAVGPDRPGLLTIFEDDEKFAALLSGGNGRGETDSEKPYSGSRSLKVTLGKVENPTVSNLHAKVCEFPQLGQYRYVVFAWKKQGGTRIQVQFANRGRLGDWNLLPGGDQLSGINRRDLRRTEIVDERGQRCGYCYEQGAVTPQTPFPLWLKGDLPKEWQIVQRDMFGDFGLLFVTGLSVNCVNGGDAWLDHCYLARTHVDLEYASSLLVNPQPAVPRPDANGILPIHRREEYPSEISRIAPLFSSLDIPHGLSRHAEHNGQTDVLRTHANAPDKPLILRGAVALPKDRTMMLDLHVSHQPQCDWQLIVRANGQIIHDQLIDATLTTPQKGWATVQVSLAKFAGQKVILEVLNQSNNWQNETAYWKRIELIER